MNIILTCARSNAKHSTAFAALMETVCILLALGSHTAICRSHHTGEEVEDLRVVVIMNHVVARASSLSCVRYLQAPSSSCRVKFFFFFFFKNITETHTNCRLKYKYII